MLHFFQPNFFRLSIFILSFVLSTVSIAQTETTFIIDSDTDLTEWVVPAGVSIVRIECIGAGGGGGFVDLVNEQGAATGGGGGGAYASSVLCVTPGETFNFNIGLGGSGQDGISNGGTTWFGNSEQDASVKAAGGFGVENNTATGGNGGSAQASIGDIVFAGGNGGNGAISGFTPGGGSPLNDVVSGGGGGAAASNLGNGNNGGNGFASWTIDFSTFSAIYEGTPGEGGVGDGYGGNGGTGAIVCAKPNQVPTLDAENGAIYGAGGGGGVRAGSSGPNRPMKPGGDGADGVIIITIIAKDITLTTGPDLTICEGEEVTIQGEFTYEGDQSLDVSFVWDGIDFVEGETTITPTIAPTESYLYTVHPIIEGCELEDISDIVKVSVYEKPIAPVLTIDNALENNCHGREITIEANGGNNPSGSGLEWIVSSGNQLDFPDPTNQYVGTDTPSETTTYTIVIAGNGSCEADSSQITYELPTIIEELAEDNESATCYLSGDQPIHFYNPISGKYIGSINPQNQEGTVTMTVSVENTVNFQEACEVPGNESFWTAYLPRTFNIKVEEGQFNTETSTIMLPFLSQERIDLTLAAGDGGTLLGTLTPNNLNDDLSNGIVDLGITLANGEICAVGTTTQWITQNTNGDTPNNISNAEFIEVNTNDFGKVYLHASKTDSHLSLDNEEMNSGVVSMYPNPSNGMFKVAISSDKQEVVKFTVYDISGRVVSAQSIVLEIGINTIPFDISSVQAGTYLLTHDLNGNTLPIKLIIE